MAEKENKKANNAESANKKKEKCNSQVKTDHLFAWECTSISEVRKVKDLKFIVEKGKRKDIRNKNKSLPHIHLDRRKGVMIKVSNKPYHDLGLILDTLIFQAQKINLDLLALGNNDEIFKYIGIHEFKNKFNELQRKINKNKRQTDLKIMIYKPPSNIEDDVIKMKIIKEFHNAPQGGHTGVKRTINKIKQRYIWKNLNKMVKKFVNECETCAKNKRIKHTKEKLIITNTPSTSFEIVSADTVGPLKISKDFRYILTLQCELTKYVEAIPIVNKEAVTIARAIVEKFILKYGNFKILKTDMGTEFVNEVMKNVYKYLKIEHITSTPYHQETLGSIERNHRVLNEYLLSFAQGDDLDDWIPYYTFCYNVTPHTDTGYTPYELVFGKIASLPNDINLEDKTPIYNYEEYANELKFRLNKAHEKAKKLLESMIKSQIQWKLK